ncbi:MAG: glycine C-acetyltransferase [Acidobacteria bacterium]|jgi:glycine C-acetyltransferase|nr:glycine C-acetyltransferase [Thermoanaerobaculia bacterium]NLN12303.1 glycine C-acetyltransferase [Acidobacteriota bacterium]OQC40587.1 MAG: 2-amino-3-ketobutyrate coenzyme A ligase [Acidobacteria bacterium ADurb.Bin051]MBP7813058.1 glycine C-acetyltransferase [Thermoanaerobaculia bacterium]MBP8845622.1 glycine C-acetyltransferase [Thermoanaerobaculia bacterium]
MAYANATRERLRGEIAAIREAGLFKEERFIHAPQGAEIDVEFPAGAAVQPVINLCANNYLGLSSHPEVLAAAHAGLDRRGYGMSSVRFICGTQDLHRELERALSAFLGVEDTLLFPSCMDANAGVFEALFDEPDVLIADRLVHASIVDGMRLSKAMRDTYKHADMGHLEQKLAEHQDRRTRVIVTDGVFSMDGDIAPLDEIVALAERYDAMVFVDDSHASGFIGATGRGTHEAKGVLGKIDIITTTLGKALGGASGGCVSGHAELVELCRQRARPYLFSNSVPPVIVAAALKVIELVSRTTERRDKLEENARYWRRLLTEAGFDLKAGESPIVPVMLYNAKIAQEMARELFAEGIYVVGFFFPVVPKGQARIRTQLSAAHEKHHLDRAIEAFVKVGDRLGVRGLGREEIAARFGL